MNLDSQSISIINSIIGEFEVINEYRKSSNRTGVFEIRSNNQTLYVKIHNRLSRWNPEVYAFENWIPAIFPFAPKLLHSFNEGSIFGIIITPIKGKTINEFKIADEKILEKVYFKAGELIRLLHDKFQGKYFGIPSVNGNPFEQKVITDAVDYITSSLDNILKQGNDKGLINSSDKNLIEWCLSNTHVFSGCKPVPTNLDFSPQNWMVDNKGNFTGIIDFENMLWGIDLDSFGIVTERYTYNKPKLLKAMFDGYGLNDDLKSQIQLRILRVNLAVTDIFYGSSINDTRIFTLGRNLLDSLK